MTTKHINKIDTAIASIGKFILYTLAAILIGGGLATFVMAFNILISVG